MAKLTYDGPKITARQAFDAGATRYFTGRACKRGHVSQRMVSNGQCTECLANARAYQRTKAWRAAHPGARAIEAAKYRTAHPDKEKAKKERYRAANIETIRERDRNAKARMRKVNPEAERGRLIAFKQRFDAKREAAAGRPKPECCEICHSTDRIVYDHSHATEAFRGWICDRCNKTLGHVKDDPALLYALAEYLEAGNVQALFKTA